MTISPVKSERRSLWRIGPHSTWTTVLPVTFIIASLLSLVILPIVVANRTARMRGEISRVAEPARREANQIQVDLSAELDKIIAYQVTGQEQYRTAYFQLVEHQEANRRALERLAPQLGQDLTRDLGILTNESNRWHRGVRDGEFFARPLPQEVFTARLFEKHPAYEKSQIAASNVEMALQAAIEERLQNIRVTERWNMSLTIVLTMLALTSAMLVAGLGRQMRLLAAEAEKRRKEAEKEAADAERARESAEEGERRAAFVAAAAQELTASLDYEQTINTLARLIVPNLAHACTIDMTDADGALHRVAAAHRNPELQAKLVADIGKRREDVPEMLVRIMDAHETRVVGTASGMHEYATGRVVKDSGTLLVIPLVSRGQNLGVIIAIAPEGKPYTQSDVPLFDELARNASLAIDNARLYRDSQQAVRAREEVLAIVSHDLRNPLNAVTLAASLLKMSQRVPVEDREQIVTIDLSAKRMSRLIEDLLDVTRLEGGKRLPIEPAPVELQSVFEETYDMFKVQAAASSVTLQMHVGDIPSVHADRHRILQVLSNLVGNALKFTPRGGVVSFSAETKDDEVLVSVADSGPGIPAKHLKDIFSPYWQAKRTERLGAGLGLPIAKGIVGAHGGRIWVESEPGKGAKFFFTLQVSRAGREVTTASAESPASR